MTARTSWLIAGKATMLVLATLAFAPRSVSAQEPVESAMLAALRHLEGIELEGEPIVPPQGVVGAGGVGVAAVFGVPGHVLVDEGHLSIAGSDRWVNVTDAGEAQRCPETGRAARCRLEGFAVLVGVGRPVLAGDGRASVMLHVARNDSSRGRDREAIASFRVKVYLEAVGAGWRATGHRFEMS